MKCNGGLTFSPISIPFVSQVTLTKFSSLQDLGDIRQLIMCYLDLKLDNPSVSETVHHETLKKALQDVVKEIEVWAQQYEADGQYKDAAYLYGRIYSDLKEDSGVVPTLAAVYEKMGDYPAAELAQEKLIGINLSERTGDKYDKQNHEIKMMSRLLKLFHTRLQVSDFASRAYAKLAIISRAAVLDLEQLNAALIDQGLIVLDFLYQGNCSSLHLAVKKNALNLARLLVQKGADPNLRDDSGATPLHAAVGTGTEEMVQLLLDHGADTEVEDCLGSTAIQRALSRRRDDLIILRLIEKGANIEARDCSWRTPLSIAIASNLPSTAQMLIGHGADVNATWRVSVTSETLLFEAVRQEKEWAVNLLLEKGANLLARDEYGQHALYSAVKAGQESMIKVLLDHGGVEAATAFSHWGSTLLHCAVTRGNSTIVGMILQAGADIDRQNSFGDTPLHSLIRSHPAALAQNVSLLLDHGADVNVGNSKADTPLHLAVRYGQSAVVQMVLDAGARPLHTNLNGQTALSMAEIESQDNRNPQQREVWKSLTSKMWGYTYHPSYRGQDK